MKKNEFLQDAIGLIGDDLILDAKAVRASKKKKYTWVKWGAMAASIFLIVTCVFAFLQIGSGPAVNLPAAENLWQQENFQAYSLAYEEAAVPQNMAAFQPPVAQTISLSNKQVQNGTIASKALSVAQPKTVKLESLIAERYVVYYSDKYMPVIYDIVEDKEVDLEERIIGENQFDVEAFIQVVYEQAELLCPGILDSEDNRQYLREYVHDYVNLIPEDAFTVSPDLGFLDAYEQYRDLKTNVKWSIFYDFCHKALIGAMEEMGVMYESDPVSVQMIAFDPVNGVFLVTLRSIRGGGMAYLAYDIVTDTYRELPSDIDNSILSITTTSGYKIRFSKDASVVTVASPESDINGEHGSFDPTKPFLKESLHREVGKYMGENIGAYYLDADIAYRLETEEYMGASEAYISDSGSVIYYKQMKPQAMGKTFYCSDAVWWNRLQLFSDDTDFWVFCYVNTNLKTSNRKIVLQGNFVRFIADETAVIMERDGEYFVYSLRNGKEITESVINGEIDLLAHERLQVYYKDGRLYKKDMFADSREISIAEADQYVLSNDSAFAFVYNNGDKYVTCYNVASLESVRVSISDELCEQIFNTENAVFRMIYKEAENTLLFTFYVDEDAAAEDEEAVDFFGAVEAYDPDGEYGKVYTNLKVGDAIVELFRSKAAIWEGGGNMTPSFYPYGFTPDDDIDSVCQKLGITLPTEDYLDVNGTQFILYQDEDETLSLIFKKGWVLYDFPEEDAGIMIEYIQNGEIHYYNF